MSRTWKQTGLTIVLSGIGVVLAVVVGLFVYMNATMRPLHPDPKAVSSVVSSAPSPEWAGVVEQARQAVRAGLIAQNLPGLSVAVGVGNEIVWAEGFGWANLETHAPVTPQSRFRTGGVSNALTSAAVGLLVEKGQLNLDNEIQNYVRDFPDKQWRVTLRQLMGHMAGISKDEGDEEPLSHCDGTGEGLKRFADRPLLYEPDSKYRYSPYGGILVSAAVEAAGHEPFFTFMRTHIFEPIGMHDTVPDSETPPMPERVAFYYPKFAGDPRYGPDPSKPGDYSCFAGGGAFLSTPSDLVRFGLAMNGGKLLQPATIKSFQTPQRLASGEDTGYGLGWDLETVALGGQPTRMAGHDSEFIFGGTATFMTFAERGLVVAVMTNSSFADTESLATTIAQAFEAQAKRAAPKG